MSSIRYTLHAVHVPEQRGIDRHWVERVVDRPDRTQADPLDPQLVRAFGTVPERDGRVLRVVYSWENDGVRVVTAFLDRGARR